jgi:hypothetical protein
MTTYGVPTGGVPRREDEATTRARKNAIKEQIYQDNIAASEYIRNSYMEAREREDDLIESEAFAAIVPASALDKQVAGNHYKTKKIQPVAYIHANNLGFLEGCIVKRITRWRDKPAESRFQDLEKIKHEIDLLIELETKK